MGFYVQLPENKDKAEQLVKQYGAELVLSPEKFDLTGQNQNALICVVDNTIFEAAGIAFDDEERQRFLDDQTGRPRVWLSLSKDTAIALCGTDVPFTVATLQ